MPNLARFLSPWTFLALLVLAAAPRAGATPPAPTTLYWVETTTDCPASATIQRLALDGSPVEELLDVASTDWPNALAVDVEAGFLYWSASGSGLSDDDGIHRSELDGSGAALLVPSDSARGLALDLENDWMYWLAGGGCVPCGPPFCECPRVERARLDGSDLETVLVLDGNLSDLVIDHEAGRFVVSDRQFAPELVGAELDGSDDTVLVGDAGDTDYLAIPADSSGLFGIAGGLFLPCGMDCAEIWRSELDGSGRESVFDLSALTEPGVFSLASHLTIDDESEKLYWWLGPGCGEDGIEGTIYRTALDGSGLEAVVDGLGLLTSLAVVPGRSGCVDDDLDGFVTLCHKGKTKSLPAGQVFAHLNHGDTCGPCE